MDTIIGKIVVFLLKIKCTEIYNFLYTKEVTFFYLKHACILIEQRKIERISFIRRNYIATTLYLAIFIVNVLIYFKSSRWRKQQHLYVQPFTFLIDYYIFIIPITVLILGLALPGIFISGNHALDTIMTNIFMIELCLFGLPTLLLWNFYMVYPNLKFLCSLYDKKF